MDMQMVSMASAPAPKNRTTSEIDEICLRFTTIGLY